MSDYETYNEHAQLRDVTAQKEACKNMLEWLREHGTVLARRDMDHALCPLSYDPDVLVADFFGDERAAQHCGVCDALTDSQAADHGIALCDKCDSRII